MTRYTITRAPLSDTDHTATRAALEVTCVGCRRTWSYTATDLADTLAELMDWHDVAHDDARLTWTPEHSLIRQAARLRWPIDGHRRHRHSVRLDSRNRPVTETWDGSGRNHYRRRAVEDAAALVARVRRTGAA